MKLPQFTALGFFFLIERVRKDGLLRHLRQPLVQVPANKGTQREEEGNKQLKKERRKDKRKAVSKVIMIGGRKWGRKEGMKGKNGGRKKQHSCWRTVGTNSKSRKGRKVRN